MVLLAETQDDWSPMHGFFYMYMEDTDATYYRNYGHKRFIHDGACRPILWRLEIEMPELKILLVISGG